MIDSPYLDDVPYTSVMAAPGGVSKSLAKFVSKYSFIFSGLCVPLQEPSYTSQYLRASNKVFYLQTILKRYNFIYKSASSTTTQ